MWQENSLEPENWDEFKQCGRKMLDKLFTYIENIGEEKVWWPLNPNEMKKFEQPIPMEEQSMEASFQEFLDDILKNNAPMNIHPGFLGWVMGCGNPVGVLAEMLAAGMNSNVIGGIQVTCNIEAEIINWFKQIFGFQKTASGLLTSGCSQANLIALITARNQVDNERIRACGVDDKKGKMVFYTSVERHHSIDKAIEIIGIGSKYLRLVPVNDNLQMDVTALEELIQKDKEDGLYPVAIVANIGTVNSGAIDDLEAIHKVSSKHHLWLHVDGAVGAWAVLTEQYKELQNKLSFVDSIAFDLHKWMYIPYGVGCVLVNNERIHYEAFSASSAYMEHREVWFSDYGIELSRDFKALKVWLCLKTYGLEKYKKLIEEDIAKAHYLASLIQESGELELLAPVSLNVVCFRYRGNETNSKKIDEWNKRIVMLLQFEGKVFPSETVINNKYAIRVSIVNYKCQKSHLDYLMKRVIEIGRKIS